MFGILIAISKHGSWVIQFSLDRCLAVAGYNETGHAVEIKHRRKDMLTERNTITVYCGCDYLTLQPDQHISRLQHAISRSPRHHTLHHQHPRAPLLTWARTASHKSDNSHINLCTCIALQPFLAVCRNVLKSIYQLRLYAIRNPWCLKLHSPGSVFKTASRGQYRCGGTHHWRKSAALWPL